MIGEDCLKSSNHYKNNKHAQRDDSNRVEFKDETQVFDRKEAKAYRHQNNRSPWVRKFFESDDIWCWKSEKAFENRIERIATRVKS